MTLNYVNGIWVGTFLIGGTLLYKRGAASKRQGPLMLTVLAGFAGVILILRPTLAQNQLFAGLVGLISGLLAALAYLQVTALGQQGEPEDRTVFYFALGSAIGGGSGVLVTGLSAWHWQGAVWLLPMGLLFFNDEIALMGWLGMLLILASGALATALRARALPNPPAEDH